MNKFLSQPLVTLYHKRRIILGMKESENTSRQNTFQGEVTAVVVESTPVGTGKVTQLRPYRRAQASAKARRI